MVIQLVSILFSASNQFIIKYFIITRVSEVIMFSPCVFVCLFVCLFVTLFVSLSRCLSGRFNYEGLVPYKQYFAGTVLGMSSCASYVSRTHDVIDDVPRSQSRSNFKIITRVSEVIMFSPYVFVCLFVCLWLCLCLYHDFCLDDLTMKDWCHTNNILQVHCWGCLVVQVMFHALMTSSMTSPGHKVGQILKVTYLRQYLS